jgi:hypothetical protein
MACKPTGERSLPFTVYRLPAGADAVNTPRMATPPVVNVRVLAISGVLRRRRCLPWAVVATAMLGAGFLGCDNGAETIRSLQQRVDRTETDLRACTQMLADRDAQIDVLDRQIDNLDRWSGLTLDDLFTVTRIAIASRSGGADYDGQPGDDGVTVYLRLFDEDGDALKAAGEIVVQLTDLTQPGAPRDLGTYIFSRREELRKSWYSGLGTNHYTLKCPFQPAVRGSVARELNVRVTFLDWLTGKTFSTSATVAVDRIDPGHSLAPQS